MILRSQRPWTYVRQDYLSNGLPRLCSVQLQRPKGRWHRLLTNRAVSYNGGGIIHDPVNSDISPESGGDSISSVPHRQAMDDAEILTPETRRPRSLQAIFLRPLKRKAIHGVPACDLQLRSYSPRNVEFFADFALRAAYYLGLPASGPVPLPKITERWTVPRSNFIFKKSQENFERLTYRRLIQIQDANTKSVEIWLAFLRKHAYYGVGMKANVWQYEELGVGKTMNIHLEDLRSSLNPDWAHFGRRKTVETIEKVSEMINDVKLDHSKNV